jgi:phospholipid/cholesterol/gamma-HCH transport system substrate-binding protein
MANQGKNNIRLGLFVLTGLFALMLTFFIISKNHNLFGSGFVLKVQFSDLSGLVEGNNVLFSGIQAGTVKSIKIINDTTIEVSLTIDDRVKSYIHKNALAVIGSAGLMGNKVVNIIPVPGPASNVQNGDLLMAKQQVSMDAMLQTFSKTNNNVDIISESLKRTVFRIDSSKIFDLLNDQALGQSLRSSLENIDVTTSNASELTYALKEIINATRRGKGSAGVLLTDTVFAGNLKQTLAKMKQAGDNADKLVAHLNDLVGSIDREITNGNGTVHLLLQDSAMARSLSLTMSNVQKGTYAFNQNMEALKHNFFFRGYFKRQRKRQNDSIANIKNLASNTPR